MMLALTVGLIAALSAGSVLAHGGYRGYYGPRTSVGVVIGAPLYWGGWGYYPRPYPYYYPPAYYYPPVVVSPPAPTVYIERPDNVRAAPERTPQDYWYYCPESEAYYPYVKQCAKGWQRVTPQPQN